MREYFTSLGYEVDCASELEEAEILIAQHAYALVIADLRLTGSSGSEGLEIVKTVRVHRPDTRVIMLTAYGSPEIEAEAKRRGVDAFLHKPKPLAEVAQLASQFLKGAVRANGGAARAGGIRALRVPDGRN